MAQVSKYPVSKKVGDRIFEVFIKTLVKIKDNQEAEIFASDLFSPTEKVMLAKRIAIAFLLLKGYRYRDISLILRVSLTTIASVNLSLKFGKGGYVKILNKISRKENLEEFFIKITEKLLAFAETQRRGEAWRYLLKEVQAAKHKRATSF